MMSAVLWPVLQCIFLPAVWSASLAPLETSVLDLTNSPVIGETNQKYASYTIDASYNRGFVHIDFNNPNLLAGAISLQPSTVRFGGGGNDYLHYAPFDRCDKRNHTDGDNYVCLNTTHWDALYNLAHKSDTDFIFGISYDMVQACAHASSSSPPYEWDPAPAAAMIRYMQSRQQTIWGFELGNEVNNRQKSCNTTGGQQAAAFARFRKELLRLYPDAATRPKLLGPDVGYLDPRKFLGDFLGNFSELYAVTYHVYSWLSKRNWNFTMPLDNAVRDGEQWYPPMVHRLAPGAQVWAGEDGPVGGGEDGTCGQNNSVCGTYATVPWYANDLGHRAALGFSQYQRQDLVGGRYSLLGSPHDNEFLGTSDPVRLHPDFWVNFLWKRVMGVTVLNATLSGSLGPSLDPSVRAYVHCGKPPSPHPLVPAAKHTPMGITLINLNSTTPKRVQLRGAASGLAWTLTAGANGYFGHETLLNRVPLPAAIADGRPLGRLPTPGVPVSAGSTVTLPPFSVCFIATECVH